MAFWNQRFWFDRSGDRYVFRPMAFSRGYDVSESEKDQLFRELMRLSWRMSCEGLAAVAMIAVLLMTGLLETAQPIRWFVLLGVCAVGALAATGIARRNRLIGRILHGRQANIPRLPFRAAVARPRPLITKRYAMPVLRSVVVLFWLCLAVLDGLTLYLCYLAYTSVHPAEMANDRSAQGAVFVDLIFSAGFWLGFVLMNATLISCTLLMARELRRLSRLPDIVPSSRTGSSIEPP